MFQISFPYRAPYIAAIMLAACSVPLYLANLPNIKILFIISFFCGALIVFKRSILASYGFIFTIVFSLFVYQAQQHQESRLGIQDAKKQFLLMAMVIDFPKKSIVNGQVNVSLKVRLNADVTEKNGRIVLRKNSFLVITCYRCRKVFSLGEIWRFQAKLKPPYGSASWGAFDYEKYAFVNQIVATGYLQEKSAIKQKSDKTIMSRLRQKIHFTLDQNFTRQNPQSKSVLQDKNASANSQKLNADNLALLKALIVGDRTQLQAEHWKLFRETGTSHLMSISGLHITLVFFLMSFLVRMTITVLLNILPLGLSRGLMERYFYRISLPTFSMLIALIVAILYAFVAGLSVPTQRAILMLTVICVAQLCSKNISLLEALSAAVIILLVFFPLSTLHIGFWLSAIAVFMITVLIKSRDAKWLLHCRMALAMIPVTLIFFNNAPLISPLANMILIPIVSIIVLPFALFTVLCNLSFNAIGFDMTLANKFIEYVWLLLNLLIDIVWYLLKIFSQWQSSLNEYIPLSIVNNKISISMAILAISLVLVWRLVFARSLLLLPLLVFIVIEPKENLHEGEFLMTSLDVGQGLAIVLETRSAYIIFDTGIGFSDSDSAERIILPFLKHNKRKPVTHIIVSHTDNDHIGGLRTLSKHYPLIPVLIGETDKRRLNTIKSKYKVKNITPCYAKEWHQAGVKFEIFPEIQLSVVGHKTFQNKAILNKKKQVNTLKRNNRSCVMKISSIYGSVLLPADIERVSEHEIVKKFPLKVKADVLVAAHHGSRSSSTSVFLDKVSPKVVIISAAYFSPYGHPHKEVMTRLQKQADKVLQTGHSGSIEIGLLKNGIQTREYRALHPRFWYSKFFN